MQDEKPSGPLYYADYLELDRLLSSQRMQSALHGRPAHDEMLFIIVHQAYELWFKQILWELDAVLATFRGSPVPEEAVGQAVLRLGRVVEIQRILIQQVDVLETMTPLDFLDFRDDLIPASGFQSVQFRLIENKLGMRRSDRLQFHNTPYTSRFTEKDAARVEASEKEPSLFDLIEGWLERTPFLEFGDFDFWREYRRAVDAMLAADRASIRNNPTLTEEEKTLIVACAVEQPFTTPQEIKIELDLHCATRTIDRVLIQAGLFGRVAIRTYPYTEAEKQKMSKALNAA